MSSKTQSAKKILVCIPDELFKKMERFKSKYKNRSEMIRQALEVLVTRHNNKALEKEFKEGFRALRKINNNFAETSMRIGKEGYKN